MIKQTICKCKLHPKFKGPNQILLIIHPENASEIGMRKNCKSNVGLKFESFMRLSSTNKISSVGTAKRFLLLRLSAIRGTEIRIPI